MKKGSFLRNVLDTIRQPNQQPSAGSGPGGSALECCGGQLRPQHFALGQVARHGFPTQPSALAYDPVQRLAAIGTESGALRVFGRPGADAWAQHPKSAESGAAATVTHIRFIVNQGALITVTSDDGIHLWSLRGPQLKLQFSAAGAPVLSPSPVPPAAAAATKQPQNSSLAPMTTSMGDTELISHDNTAMIKSSSDNNSKQLQILHTLKFKREHITCIHQALLSKWLYVGTERGNVHVVNAETFQLSGYSVAWNRAIELARKTHPGAIIHLSECPQDANKLLIGYQSGCVALWDLKARTATCRYYHFDNLTGLSWLYDGKQFVASHANGSLVTWQARSGARPAYVFYPHCASKRPLPAADQSSPPPQLAAPIESFGPIAKVEWRVSPRNNSEQMLIFSGGLVQGEDTPEAASSPIAMALSVMLGKSITVLDLQQPIVDFYIISEGSPHENEPSEPSAAIVLLENELLIIDLQSAGYPPLRSPYSAAKLALESPVTCIHYLADCSAVLVPQLCSGSNRLVAAATGDSTGSSTRYSEREWPIAGGEWDSAQQSYPELVLTGHLDGSVVFWDISGLNMDLLASLKTCNLFEAPEWPPPSALFEAEAANDKLPKECPFSIRCLEFCSTSSRLLVAGALGQVIQFKLADRQAGDATVLQIEPPPPPNELISNQSQGKRHFVLKTKGPTPQRASAASGSSQNKRQYRYQPELICLSPLRQSNDHDRDEKELSYRPPARVTAMAFESAHSILAYAHDDGVVLVDVIQKSVIISASLADLYGGGSLTHTQDVAIQPFATSSILQQHYQASSSPLTANNTGAQARGVDNNNIEQHRTPRPLSGIMASDNGAVMSNESTAAASQSQGGQGFAAARQPRSAAVSAFQRQLSTTALRSEPSSASSPIKAASRDSSVTAPGSRLFQRQMTASQLLSSYHHHDGGAAGSSNQRAAALLAAARGQPAGGSASGLESSTLASSTSCLSGGGSGQLGGRSPRRQQPETSCDDLQQPQQHRQKPASGGKGKRIISRMLSISAIHSSLGGSEYSIDSSGQPATTTAAGSVPTAASLDQDKIDSSFTRSRSSSCSSDTSPRTQAPQLSNGEFIQCLYFLDWPARDLPNGAPTNNNKSLGSIDGSAQAAQLALWLGTSQGSVLSLALSMPDNVDNRILQLQSVNAEPMPQATIKLRGAIRCLSAFTPELVTPPVPSGGQPSSPPPLMQSTPSSLEAGDSPHASFESRKSPVSANSAATASNRSRPAQLSHANAVYTTTTESRSPPTFLAIVSERQARIYQLPQADQLVMAAQSNGSAASGAAAAAAAKPLINGETSCVAKAHFPAPVQSAALMQMRQPAECCLATQLAANGQLMVHSLPQLRVLMEGQLEQPPAAYGGTIIFGHNGHALYQPSANEIAKFTLSAQYKSMVSNMSNHLYVAREMPEAPRSNFFKSLLGSVGTSLTSKQCDRDELFGGAAASEGSFLAGMGKAQGPRALAKHIGSTGMDRLRGATTGGGLAADMRAAREGLDERGEKLSEIEDRTLQMMNQAETYSQTSHQLAQKFKDKKWYQF